MTLRAFLEFWKLNKHPGWPGAGRDKQDETEASPHPIRRHGRFDFAI